MRYHNITKADMLNGEGLRVVLWVSGCSHHCPGCQNAITWDPNDGLIFDDAAKKEIFDYIDEADRLIVPYNQPKALPGVGSRMINVNGKKVRVTSLLGITFMDGKSQNPFEAIDDILIDDTSDIHIVDIHAEATSEKIALGYYLDGKVSAVLGTHTHVPTADEKILPNKTAYQSDVGMTGPYMSVIGCDKDSIISRMRNGLMTQFQPAEGQGQLLATLLKFNKKNECYEIKRIQIDPAHPFKF